MTEKKQRLAWTLALAVLAAALIGFNLPPAEQAEPGFQPGEELPDFTLTQTDGELFRLSDYRGKTVVLNLWATWCAPCIKELPAFDRLQREYPEEVKVLAIHSDLVTDDPEAFLREKQYGMAFAVDESGDVIAALGGSALLPQTAVLSPEGIVTYNQAGSVSYEKLLALAEDAAAGRISAQTP